MMTDTPVKLADLGLVVEARDAAHAAEIRVRLEEGGFVLRSPRDQAAHSATRT
jgi:hypothetical protein